MRRLSSAARSCRAFFYLSILQVCFHETLVVRGSFVSIYLSIYATVVSGAGFSPDHLITVVSTLAFSSAGFVYCALLPRGFLSIYLRSIYLPICEYLSAICAISMQRLPVQILAFGTR